MRSGLAGWVWRAVASCAAVSVVTGAPAGAAVAKRGEANALERKEFSIPELSLSSRNAALNEVLERLPNRSAWEQSIRRRAADARPRTVFVDARSGAATNILESVPLIPGTGKGNRVTLAELAQRIGRPVAQVDAAAVADAVLAHVRASRELLGIDLAQLGPAAATRTTPQLWHLSIPQRYRGVPVRHARVSATLSHGNLVGLGAHTWDNVALDPAPRVTAEEALAAGFQYAEGRAAEDDVSQPTLEILPIAPPEHQSGRRYVGPLGEGYRHRLVWTFEFSRPPGVARWQVTVDAHSGEVIAFGDANHYATRKRSITGGVYPLTSTETCTDIATCGVMQTNTPMPFASFADFPVPNRFANSAGIYDYAGGTTATQLLGARVYLSGHGCGGGVAGNVNHASPSGVLALGGVSGQHDCDSAGPLAWNTPAARTSYYEANKISEIAAGYLPDNISVRGLGARVGVELNGSETCNAFYSPAFNRIGFFRSGGGCRNTGEIAHVVQHEWGHFLDENDANAHIRSTGEGYADIAALYRTQQSCLGPGFFVTNDDGCGMAPDGTGANSNEASPSGSYCTTQCSGVRDADWLKHVPGVPADPLGFVCGQCDDASFGHGPCGKRVHCGATPISQAAWDLVARDLLAPPHNLDSQTAFIVGNKLFYQGSDNVGEWFACECGASADGCHEDSGYMKWLMADDDNGVLHDGTPHMTAIFDAFDRHGIACAAPTPEDGGCAGGPTGVANVTATPGAFSVVLEWTAVPNATRYWVFRTEGPAGCNYGKALIAEVTGLTYTDTEVAAGRPYFYNVVAVGASSACFGRVSPCVAVTPGTGNFTISCSPGSVGIPTSPLTTCSVNALGGFGGQVDLGCAALPPGATCRFEPSSVTVGANGSATSELTVFRGIQTPNGSFAFKVRGTPPVVFGGLHETSVGLNVGAAGDLFAAFDPSLGVPSCGTAVGRSCDTGPSLVRFRDGRGPEPNQPNALGGACADGTLTLAGGNGSNDRIRVATADGTPFAPGKSVAVTATVQTRAAFAQDAAEFFFAADASHPVWQHIETVVPPAGGTQQLAVRYALPAGSRQAVRVLYRRQGTPACFANSVNDTDDLVFAVGN